MVRAEELGRSKSALQAYDHKFKYFYASSNNNLQDDKKVNSTTLLSSTTSISTSAISTKKSDIRHSWAIQVQVQHLSASLQDD